MKFSAHIVYKDDEHRPTGIFTHIEEATVFAVNQAKKTHEPVHIKEICSLKDLDLSHSTIG